MAKPQTYFQQLDAALAQYAEDAALADRVRAKLPAGVTLGLGGNTLTKDGASIPVNLWELARQLGVQ